jgi:phosphoribosyl-dephospho-CoA transferase
MKLVIARSVATRQSMQRFSYLKRKAKQKGRLDCHVALLLAMTVEIVGIIKLICSNGTLADRQN